MWAMTDWFMGLLASTLGMAVGGLVGWSIARRTQSPRMLVPISPALGITPVRDPLARAYRGSADGFWEWTVPSNEVLFSDSFKALMGFAPDELPDRYEAWEQRLHPADHDPTISALQRHLTDHSPYDVEYRLLCKDNTYRWFQARGQAEWDSSGSPLVMAGSITDVSRRKEAEEELKSSQRLYLSLVENLPVFLIRKDLTGRFTFCNQAFCDLLGKSRESILGSTDYDHFPAELAEKYRQDDARVMKSGRRFDDVEETQEGDRRGYFQVIKTPLHDAAGTIVGTQAVFWDVTDRRRAEIAMREAKEEAEQANRAKSEFVANMSHEIRTPLNAIIGMTELVLETDLSSAQRDYLRTVMDSGESLLSVINQILDFSKIEAGQLQLDVTRIELRELLGNTMKSLAVRGHRKGLELLLDVAETVPDVLRGDAGRLRQIVVNLVGNAIKFTERGEVLVAVSRAEEPATGPHDIALLFQVRDTGIGIATEHQAKIFHAFQQADTSMTRRFGGTGLGLSISKELVELMHGRIWVESEIGRGTTFSFVIHLEIDPDQEPSLRSVPSVDGIQALIVDDNATNRHLLEEILRNWGMRPSSVADAGSAVSELKRLTHDDDAPIVVITDVNMPDIDGYSMIEQIRSDQDLSDLPVIVLSSSSSRQPDRCALLGVAAELLKPVKQSELREAIGRAMGIVQWSDDANGRRSVQTVSRSLEILVAEDGLANQKLIRGILDRWGHHVTCVVDGEQAVRAWQTGSFDLILMDVQMPTLDGYQATRQIRQLEQGSGHRVPILAVTAHSMSGDEQKCLDAGMDGYVSKPVRQDQLHETIQRVVTSGPMPQPPATQSISSPDFDPALQAVGGDRELLKEVLSAMAEELPQLVDQLQAALQADDAVGAQRAAHTIKGSSRIVPRCRLHDLAEEAERLAHDTQLELITAHLPQIREETRQLCEQLHNYLHGPPASS